MKIAIYGAGGLGGYYGARLAGAGNDVAFIARGAHLEAIRKRGLQISSPLGDMHLPNPTATDDPADVGPVDLVVVAVKTWQIPEVAAAMGPLLDRDTVVLPFLNGVEASDELAAVIGPERVLGGLSKVFSKIASPGVIHHFTANVFVAFGELDGTDSERVRSLLEVFSAAGVDAEASPVIRVELWKKLLLVSSWAGLGALARSPMGVVREEPEIRSLIGRSMEEGLAVARATGHDIDLSYKDEMWAFYRTMPAGATASMQRDIIDGRPSELDAWNGAVCRFGVRAGVETPVHSFTYHMLLPMERRARGLS
ncbi:MAG: 2-dehydropantoate 2-reductase [Thiotrichales bacterium]|nr:2-dehydropantoate 2-reductase [Thiotrichales bacterium]